MVHRSVWVQPRCVAIAVASGMHQAAFASLQVNFLQTLLFLVLPPTMPLVSALSPTTVPLSPTTHHKDLS